MKPISPAQTEVFPATSPYLRFLGAESEAAP